MELFVSFTEVMQFFKRHIRQFIIVVALFGIVFGLLPLRFYHHEYSASTTILVSCEVPENAGTDYRLQYTSILSTRVQAGVAMANGTDLIKQTAQRLGIKEDQITSIGASQVSSAPMIKVSVSSPNASLVSQISDTAAQVLGEKLVNSFPSPKLSSNTTDKAVPQNPVSNKSTMAKTGLLGLIVGFILYICFGFIIVLTDKTIRNNDYVSEALHTNFLGMVTKHGSEEKKLNAYRKMRAAAVHQAGQGRTFLISDVCTNNGASSIAAGLASVITRSEKTVLLIDADVRSHQIAKLLNVQPEKNLSDVLDGACSTEQAIISTSINGLSLIAGSEKNEENLSDILATDKFGKLLSELSPKYDYVVVNVPSEVRFPDADNMASLFDSVIMVAKYGSTPYHEFKDSFLRLKTAGANIIGFVTTNC